MIDCSIDLIKQMIAKRNTSYKLFLMKFIILYSDIAKRDFSFRELASGLISCSLEYFEKRYKKYNKNDRIFECLQYIFETYDEINIYSSQKTAYEFLLSTNDKVIIAYLNDFIGYAVYRLLTPFIVDVSLKNLGWHQQNKIIGNHSIKEEMFYAIYGNRIQLNSNWLNYIFKNKEILLNYINGVLDYEFSK